MARRNFNLEDWKYELTQRKADSEYNRRRKALPKTVRDAIGERWTARRTVKTGQTLEATQYEEGNDNRWYQRRIMTTRAKGATAIDTGLQFLVTLKREAPEKAWRSYAQVSYGRNRKSWVGSNVGSLSNTRAWLLNLLDREPEIYPGADFEEVEAFRAERVCTLEVIAYRRAQPPPGLRELMALVRADE